MTGGLFRTPEEKRRFIKQQLLSVGLLLFIDVGLPLAIYYVMKMYVSILVALILSGVPPFINVIVKFIRNRKVDALGCIFVFSYVLSGILSIISGDVRLALLRDSTVTCVIACAFLITLIPIKTKWFDLRPLTYIIAQSFVSELPPVRWVDKDGQDQEQPLLEFLWHHVQLFRLHNYVMTFLWGFFLMAEFITKLLMIKSTMSVDNIVWISNVIVIAVVCLLSTISSIGSTIVQKRAKKYTIEWRKENDYAEMYKSNQVNDPTAGLDQQNSIDKPKPVITAESTPQLV
ncbi:hypothetical protein BC941DRAFT_355688 [Chlamydoabsidia padenii]|nr:hypothetical protein BC941DRAFT_355688 [Chlamydoabsidia padenii]